MEGTFIKIDRKIIKWQWFSDPVMLQVFIYLLVKANIEDRKWEGIIIKRGQLISGRLKLALALNLSEMKIRTCLSRLKSTNEITIQTTNRYSIITICKYDDYQQNKKKNNQRNNQQTNQQTTNKQPTNNQQITTTKEYIKNDKNDKKEKEKEISVLKNLDGKNEKEPLHKNLLKNSNLFREPNVPVFEDVHRVFLQNGGNEKMAKTFFNSYESVGWFKNGSPITNFSNLVPSYVENWKKNELKKQTVIKNQKGFHEVPENIDYDNLSMR